MPRLFVERRAPPHPPLSLCSAPLLTCAALSFPTSASTVLTASPILIRTEMLRPEMIQSVSAGNQEVCVALWRASAVLPLPLPPLHVYPQRLRHGGVACAPRLRFPAAASVRGVAIPAT